MKNFAIILLTLKKGFDRVLMLIFRSLFNKIGNNVVFHPINSVFSYRNISIGNNVSIGEYAYFMATISHIYIGNNIAFAPKVTIRGGNHSSHLVGKLMIDYKNSDKKEEDDQPVYIQDDVWIGTNVTILKGVTIGRGSIVGAGSVVNRDVPPYSIVAGIPAKVIKKRWNVSDILKHEILVYKEEERLSLSEIE